MDRRRFSRTLLKALGGSAFLPGILRAEGRKGTQAAPLGRGPAAPRTNRIPQEGLRINGPRLNQWLREFSRFGAREDGGVDRVAFSDADVAGRAWVLTRLEEAELEVSLDAAGNLFGRRRGSEGGLSPLMLGSHIDSVPAGGNYDGPLGSLGAIEVVRTLNEAGVTTRHPLEVVIFVNEEGGKTGSRILAGEFQDRELGLETASGFTIREGIRRLGGDPDLLAEARREPGSVAGYLELHVEQGGILEGEDTAIGVVEGIVGIRRWTATVSGSTNHAGTTPMDQRRDALLGAARLVEAVNRVVTGFPGSQVGTVGQIQASPGAPNVIPGEVRMSIEIRALDMDTIGRVMERIGQEAGIISQQNGTPISIEEFYLSAAAPTDERFRGWVEDAAESLRLSHRRMPSGAGHDAQSVARIAPMGMIFIPSVGGLSHHPDEYSRPEDIEAGANVLLGALLRADEGLD
ncbi:MAG: allantoate amidohydrolase [Longimicrobiales bacterium]